MISLSRSELTMMTAEMRSKQELCEFERLLKHKEKILIEDH